MDFDGLSPYFVVTLPLSEYLQSGIDPDMLNRTLRGDLLIDSSQGEADLLAFQKWEQELREDDHVLERAARLEVQARLLRFAHRISFVPFTHPMPMLTRADQLACYIAQNYQQPLTSQMIADANGLHPNYAMNLFRKTFGTTMTAFVSQHRISHAQRLLVTTDDAILDIGSGIGFPESQPLQRSLQNSLRLRSARIPQSTSERLSLLPSGEGYIRQLRNHHTLTKDRQGIHGYRASLNRLFSPQKNGSRFTAPVRISNLLWKSYRSVASTPIKVPGESSDSSPSSSFADPKTVM